MFRYERPQKGRLREFHQFGCESFGEDSVYEDANIIMMISTMLNFFNIGYKLQLNSLGCQKCMPSYKESLVKYLQDDLQLCEDCNRRIDTNPIRVLDCKNEKCQDQLSNAPKITNNLCDICHDDFNKLKSILDTNNIKYEIDTNLVRGLDYYTKTAFEFVSDNIGAQNAIAGGGRYDRLVEFLGGRATPAVGFAIGIERLLELIQLEEDKEPLIYIGAICEDAIDLVFKTVMTKRKTYKVITDYKARGFGKHLNNASKKGATLVALIGEDELQNGTIWVKDLSTKDEQTINLGDF
jgi:histidyl-tRNA synthetase